MSASQSSNSSILMKLGAVEKDGSDVEEEMDADYVFTATGYVRNAHEGMLGEVRELLPEQSGKFEVARDYRIRFGEGKVAEEAGIWLQGCNEGTHGVSTCKTRQI